MADHDGLIQQFISVTGADADRAKFFLEAAVWDLPTALGSFFEESGDGEASEMGPEVGSGAAASDTGATPMAGRVPPGPTPEWLTGDDSEDDDEEEERQAFYAGGSVHSGQQVLGPSKKKDVVARLFKAAKQQGAEVGPGESGSSVVKKATFKGTSYRLGETATDTQVIPDGAAAREARPVELRMYRAGFTVDDGDIRDYTDPSNQRFLADIKRGLIPRELIAASGGREVSINMSDMRHEQHEPPKKSLKAFSGSGQTLGSPAPAVVGQVTHIEGPGGSTHKAPAASADPKEQEEKAKQQLNVDASQPTTNVQIRLTDGSRIVVRANHSHTVGHLRTYLNTARPAYASQSIALMTIFPHAELAQPDQTLTEANILNSAIVVKPK